ncbi:hypothetical protein RQP46_002061 [Phenoliferia psychrophenolica]
MNATTIDLKLSLGPTTRRIPIRSSPAPTWSALESLIQARFGLDATTDSLQLVYTDSEGDKVTLSSDVELVELWDATDAVKSFEEDNRFEVVLRKTAPAANATEELSNAKIIEMVQKKLTEDPAFKHELREAVRSTGRGGGRHRGGPGHHPHPHPHPHPDFGGGHPRGPPGHGHDHGQGRWEMRDLESDSTTSSDSDDEPKDPEKPTDPDAPKEHKKHGKHGKCGGGGKRHSHGHHHHGPPPPPPHHGPPPHPHPHSHFSHHQHSWAHPPPPPPHHFGYGGPSTTPFHSHGMFGPPPPPPAPHSPPHHFGGGRRGGMRGGFGGGHGRGGHHSHGEHRGPPPPPPFGADFPFGNPHDEEGEEHSSFPISGAYWFGAGHR